MRGKNLFDILLVASLAGLGSGGKRIKPGPCNQRQGSQNQDKGKVESGTKPCTHGFSRKAFVYTFGSRMTRTQGFFHDHLSISSGFNFGIGRDETRRDVTTGQLEL
jgi:hypothetical protein